MYAYYLVPGHHIYARRLPETTGSRTIDQRSILYEWGQGSATFPETDVWIFKTRRLDLVIFTWKNPIQTSVSLNPDVCFGYQLSGNNLDV